MSAPIDQVVVKLASRCNLDCRYCYLYHHGDTTYLTRPRFLAPSLFEALLSAMETHSERHGLPLSLVLHGGEPLLIGKERLRAYLRRARERLGDRLSRVSVQTNGVRVDEGWAQLFREEGVAVGLSLDGPPAVHDASRVDATGRGSYAEVLRGLRHLQEAGLDVTALCVIAPGASGLEVYEHLKSLGIRRMDFLLPDVSHDRRSRYPIGSTPVADYLVPVFDRWMADEGIGVRLLDELLGLVLFGRTGSELFGGPRRYVVVETDGSLEPLDALRVCEDGITRTPWRVEADPLDVLVDRGLPLPAGCRGCPERELCRGGYPPHRFSQARRFDNPSVWCEDLRALFAHVRSYSSYSPSS